MSIASKKHRRNYRRHARMTLDAFTSVGCYPLLWMVRIRNSVRGWEECYCCADCAVKMRAEAIRDGERCKLSADVYYEGPPYTCDECETPIESAYGDPDAQEEAFNG